MGDTLTSYIAHGSCGGCLQAYVRDNASCSRDNMQRVLYIIDAFPRPQTDTDGSNDAVEQCSKVTLAAIKWAKRYLFLHPATGQA